MKPAILLPLLSVAVLAAGCKSRSFGESRQSGKAPHGASKDFFTINDDKSKDEEFKERMYGQPLLFVNVTGWDPGKMDPASLAEEETNFGAVVSVESVNPDRIKKDAADVSTPHCPKGLPDSQLWFKSNQFSIGTTGNKTKGTPKASYKFKWTSKDERFLGMRALSLKSMWNDASQMREKFAWGLMKSAKVPSGRHTYAMLCINDKYYGLYAVLEDIDKPYLKSRFEKHSDRGNLYKANWKDLGAATLAHRSPEAGKNPGSAYWKSADSGERTYELRTNDDKDDPPELQSYDDLAALIATVNGVALGGATPAKFNTLEYKKAVESIFDAKTFLRWLAANNLIGGWDNYWITPSNFFLYNRGHDKDFMKRPYFVWLPWDYDHSFGISYKGESWHKADLTKIGSPENNPFVYNLLANDEFMKYYLDHFEHLLERHFVASDFEKRVKDLWLRIWRPVRLESVATGCFGSDQFRCAHTGRKFSYDAIEDQNVRFKWLDWDGAKLSPIPEFVKLRGENARIQLKALRRKFPKGSSGETFE